MAGASSRKFQAPKGTRDFYPADLAVRRYIENVWRQTSINHGFDEIDGPTFEHLDLYTHKSGPGIASELFQVFSGKDPEQVAAIRKGENAPLALRPEFTPTLARMVAAKAPELPRPIKWFAIPSHFRAESPQRGRLREFMQWNVDFIGDDSPRADAEVIATAVESLARLGLKHTDVQVRISNRNVMLQAQRSYGTDESRFPELFDLLDRRAKTPKADFDQEAVRHGLQDAVEVWDILASTFNQSLCEAGQKSPLDTIPTIEFEVKGKQVAVELRTLSEMWDLFREAAIDGWCKVDFSIVRGLAYYTGTVFEIIAEGERAIAGGGRYDKLIEGFGGPSLPACGFGMGDVVLANILKDKGLLKPAEEYLPRPDAFVFAANNDAAAKVPGLVAELRRRNLHIRNTYKTTRNVGKLLGDAGKSRARYAVILGEELAESPPRVAVKNLESGEQETIELDALAHRLKSSSGA